MGSKLMEEMDIAIDLSSITPRYTSDMQNWIGSERASAMYKQSQPGCVAGITTEFLPDSDAGQYQQPPLASSVEYT